MRTARHRRRRHRPLWAGVAVAALACVAGLAAGPATALAAHRHSGAQVAAAARTPSPVASASLPDRSPTAPPRVLGAPTVSGSPGLGRLRSATSAAAPSIGSSAGPSPGLSAGPSADPAGPTPSSTAADTTTPAAPTEIPAAAGSTSPAPSSPSATADPSASGSPAPTTPVPTAPTTPVPTAASFGGTPGVGALFSGAISGNHGCSAGVVDSPAGDLIVTAAHCVTGSGTDLTFVPGYDRGAAPYGSWAVVAAYADPSWIASQDPAHDYAFLRVENRTVGNRSMTVEDVVGGAALGLGPAADQTVTVDGYGVGSDDDPITCTSGVTLTDDEPTFACGGFVDGTSGGPWLSGGSGSTPVSLVGVVGGRNQGGCEPSTSYSSPFDLDTFIVWERAAVGAAPDTLPAPGSSGCGSG